MTLPLYYTLCRQGQYISIEFRIFRKWCMIIVWYFYDQNHINSENFFKGSGLFEQSWYFLVHLRSKYRRVCFKYHKIFNMCLYSIFTCGNEGKFKCEKLPWKCQQRIFKHFAKTSFSGICTSEYLYNIKWLKWRFQSVLLELYLISSIILSQVVEWL